MAKANYKLRINVYERNGQLAAYCSISDETMELFTHPYYSVKRMQDRLAFMPWEHKGRGMVRLGDGTLQYGVQEDCEKMKDFCGEYWLVGNNDKGVVWVKLEDRHPFKREVLNRVSTTRDAVAPVMYEAGNVPSLAELLAKEITKKNGELEKIELDLTAAREMVDELEGNWHAKNREIETLKSALNVAKDGE